MVTEMISLKLENKFLDEIDIIVKKEGYQNRTEFIRNALREKVEEVKMKQAMVELSRYRGKAPRKTTDNERAKIRDQISNELVDYFDKKFK